MIYLDMDGVLADFVGGVGRHFGVPDLAPPTWSVAAELTARGVPMDEKQWIDWLNNVGVDFWAELPVLPWASALVWLCGNARVLSSPALNCEPGKIAWLERHFPQLALNPIFTSDKASIVGPDDLLIDDGEHNLLAVRKAGGRCYLWPGSWNCKRDYSHYNALVDVARLVEQHYRDRNCL